MDHARHLLSTISMSDPAVSSKARLWVATQRIKTNEANQEDIDATIHAVQSPALWANVSHKLRQLRSQYTCTVLTRCP